MLLNKTKNYIYNENRAEFNIWHSIVCLFISIAEIGLFYCYIYEIRSLEILILPHIGAVAVIGSAIWLASSRRHDLGLLSLLLVSTALTGPFGALGTTLLSFYLLILCPSPDRLDAWYERISGSIPHDSVSKMCDEIRSGRQIIDESPSHLSFIDILENGSLDQKQIMLGIISRNFDEGFLPILIRALKSPEAPIRVQAAAVANRLSSEHRNKIWMAIG